MAIYSSKPILGRVLVVSAICATFFVLVVGRLIYLQFVVGEEMQSRSKANRTREFHIPAFRSTFYDRTGDTRVAYNQASLAVVVTPAHLPTNQEQRRQLIHKTERLLQLPAGFIEQKIHEPNVDANASVVIKDQLSNADLVRFAEHFTTYQGVHWENHPKRVYPLGKKAFSVTGYVGQISPEEFQELKDHSLYVRSSILGKAGVEGQFDDQVRGVDGILVREVDTRAKVLEQDVSIDPIPGDPLFLTMHAGLQALAYDLLTERPGSVIVSKVSTGEILALASSPSLNPNLFRTDGSLDSNTFAALRNQSLSPFLNRPLQGRYPPASTFKLVVGSALLKAGVDTTRTVLCKGGMWIGNRYFRCWKHSGHGEVNFEDAIAQSCDVYFYTMGMEIGAQAILDEAVAFGMTNTSHIDIGNEEAGWVPQMDWFRKRYRRSWSQGDTANISIGQGDMLSTPMEVHLMTAAIVNDGTVYRPFVVHRQIDMLSKQSTWQAEPEVLRQVPLTPEAAAILRDSMYAVTTKGTSKSVKWYTSIPMGGKTGTAQNAHGEDHALFTGFAPYGAPPSEQIAVTVVVEFGGGGSANAAPIAAKLIDYYFKQVAPFESRVVAKNSV